MAFTINEISNNYSVEEIESAKSILELFKGKNHSEISRTLRVANYISSNNSILS